MVDNGFGTPRSVWELLGATFDLYRRYPWLFLVLAAGVIVPYQLIVLAATGSAGVGALLAFLDWALVGPLVSALHVHAVDEARLGAAPKLGSTFAKGLRALPLVAFVTVVATLGIGVGLVLFVVPGVILALRWAVVSQAAAIEREGGFAALARSADLTGDRYGHVFGLLAMAFLIGSGPLFAFDLLHAHDSAWSFLAGLALQVFSVSISALATALLYFDLRVRAGASTKPSAPREGGEPPSGADAGVRDAWPATADSWDPGDYADADRPRGWYIDPAAPQRMRYWGAGGQPQWTGRQRTPFKLRRAWREKAAAAESEA